MSEDLRGRVRTVRYEQASKLATVYCRAATLNGNAVDFQFTLGAQDPRLDALQPGSRVFYSTHGAVGVWGSVTLPPWVPNADQPIPVDGLSTARAPAQGGRRPSYGDALAFEPAPSVEDRERVATEAARMGFEVTFGVEGDRPYVEVHVPGRGKMKHYKDIAATWDEVLADAGLGGTI